MVYTSDPTLTVVRALRQRQPGGFQMAGDLVPFPGYKIQGGNYQNTGPAPQAQPYFLGSQSDPRVQSLATKDADLIKNYIMRNGMRGGYAAPPAGYLPQPWDSMGGGSGGAGGKFPPKM